MTDSKGPSEDIIGSARWEALVRRTGESHYLDSFLGQLKRQIYLDLIERWGGLPHGGRVLKTDLFEEAMGPDAWLTALSANNGLMIGIDVETSTTQRAKANDTAVQARYLAGDARRLPFAADSFDLIVSPSTLDHFPDSNDLGVSLKEIARVLAPAGRLIITLDNRQNIFDPLLRLVNRFGWTPFYLGRSYTVRDLRQALESAGFMVEETTAILQNPRLTAVTAVMLARKLRWSPLMKLVRRSLVAAQRLERTNVRYYFGSFVAAKAVRRS